jgi:hypothetical protein
VEGDGKMRGFPRRLEVAESPWPRVSGIPRVSRHAQCLANKAVVSGVYNVVMALGTPTCLTRPTHFDLLHTPRH